MVSAGISNAIINSIDSGKKVSASEKSKSSGTDFTKVLEKQSDIDNSVKNNDEKGCKVAENDEMKEIIQKHFGNSEKEIVSTDNEIEENIEEVTEAAASAITGIINLIADNLNIEPEKVIEAIDNLGFDAADMLDTNVINDVVKELTGMESMMDILTDKELSEMIKNIYMEIGEIEELFEKDFGISKEQLTDILDNNVDITPITEKAEDVVTKEVPGQSADFVISENSDSMKTATYNESDKDVSDEVINVNNADIENEEVEQENNSSQSSDYGSENKNMKNDNVIMNVNDNVSTKTEGLKTESINTESTKTETHETSKHAAGNEAVNLLSGIKETVVEKIAGEDNGLADKIIKQITDDIRMYARRDTTSLEIQLEPETLGKVSLTVASKSGVVTAQLVVQNEVAKEAVESQMTTLKESMNNQGIKIEAIEVTLASKEFEENLDKHGDASEHQEQKHKKNLTNEDLADFNVINISDEDIKEEIMKEMGNTVSYTA